MKYKIILLVGFALIAVIFVLCTKRISYYSNSGEKNMKEELFDFNCLLDEVTGDKSRLVVNFNFHAPVHLILTQLSVIAISNGTDTLKMGLASNHSTYIFPLPKNDKPKKLNLIINYRIDSAGFITNISKKYYNMEKVHTYHFVGVFYN